MNTLTELLSHLNSIVWKQEPTLSELFHLVLAFCLLWNVVFNTLVRILCAVVRNQPWIIAASEREYARAGKKSHEDMMHPVTKEQYVEIYQDMWPWFMGVLFQHFVGGILCVPSVFGILIEDKETAASLACLGIISEMGWELEDFASWVYKRYFTEHGKEKVPMFLMIILVVHHSLTCILGLPMILHYRDFIVLHWMVFELQCAAAVSIACVEYTKILDVSKPSHLLQFQIFTFLALVCMVWTRVIHWADLCWKSYERFYADEAWTFLYTSVVLTVLFTIYSVVAMVIPFAQRFMKFMKKSTKYQSLPATTDKETRRASLVELQEAAASVLQEDQNALAALFFSESREKPTRRTTMPPPKKGGLETMRRASAVLMTRRTSLPAQLRYS